MDGNLAAQRWRRARLSIRVKLALTIAGDVEREEYRRRPRKRFKRR
jgi:hypothetical protein